jgi:phage gp29-like protein
MAQRNTRRDRGRPRGIEKEVTVVSGGQLRSLPGFFPALNALQGVYELFNPDDILAKRGFKIYEEMLNDDTIKACLRFKKVLIHGRAWEIEPAGGKDASQEAKDQATFVQDVLNNVGWNRVMREVLTALDYGFSIGELLWSVEDFQDKGLKVILKDVAHRDPKWMKIDVDMHGNIVQFRQLSDMFGTQIEIQPDKVIHYSQGAEFRNHYGKSDIRACYRAWWSKKFVTQFWNVFLERFGSPLTMMKYPQGASNELKAALMNILNTLQNKTEVLVPEGVVVELIEATRAGNAGYKDALDSFDISIARAILVPGLLGMGGPTSRAADSQSRLQLRIIMKVANDIAEDIAQLFTKQIVQPLVDWNFGGVKQFPKFVFRDYGEYDSIEVADSINNLFNSGILDLDQEDVNYARSILGLPLREEGDEDEILRSPPPPIGTSPNDPNAQGAGAKAGNDRAKKGASQKKPVKQ